MTPDQTLATLQTVPAFAPLPEEALRLVADSGEAVSLKPGEALFRSGEPSDCGYVVLSGRMELVLEHGNRRKRLCELRAGALAGETALIVPGSRPATARALEACRLLKLPRERFLQVLAAYPDAAKGLRDLIAARVRETLEALDTIRAAKLSAPRG